MIVCQGAMAEYTRGWIGKRGDNQVKVAMGRNIRLQMNNKPQPAKTHRENQENTPYISIHWSRNEQYHLHGMKKRIQVRKHGYPRFGKICSCDCSGTDHL